MAIREQRAQPEEVAEAHKFQEVLEELERVTAGLQELPARRARAEPEAIQPAETVSVAGVVAGADITEEAVAVPLHFFSVVPIGRAVVAVEAAT